MSTVRSQAKDALRKSAITCKELGYTYDVRRDGMLVTQSELSKKLKQPQTRTETIPVTDYRDMSQPGTYGIQLQEVDSILSGEKVHQTEVKSNIVAVTVVP